MAPRAAAEERAHRRGKACYTAAQKAYTTPRTNMQPTVAPTGGARSFVAAGRTPAAAQVVRTASTWPTDAMERLQCARDMRNAGLISAAEYESTKSRLVRGLASPPQPPPPPQPMPTPQTPPWQQLPPQPPLRQQPPPTPLSPWLLSQPSRSLAERVQQLELELSRRPSPSPLLSPSPSQAPMTALRMQMEAKDAEIARLRSMLAGGGAVAYA